MDERKTEWYQLESKWEIIFIMFVINEEAGRKNIWMKKSGRHTQAEATSMRMCMKLKQN